MSLWNRKRKRAKQNSPLLVCAMLALSAAALAQETESPPPATAPETQQEQAAPPPKPRPILDLGWSVRNVSGNFHNFSRYATPPKGVFLRGLSFDTWSADERNLGSLWLRSVDEDDYAASGRIDLNYGRSWVSASGRRNHFFDPSPMLFPRSRREVEDFQLRHALRKDLSIGVKGTGDHEDDFFEPPKDALRQRTFTWTADVGGRIAGGFGSLQFSDWRYYDRTNVLPDNRVQMWGLTYGRKLGNRLSAQANYFRSTLKPQGGANNRVSTFGASASYDVSDDTVAHFQYRREDLHLPTVQNAYVRDRSYVRGSVVHRMRGWSGELSYRRLDVERVNADHSFVDAPTWHTVEGRVAGRLSPSVRMKIRAVRESLDGKFGMQTDDNRALYWRNRTFGQLGLDATAETTNAYLLFNFNERRNDVRDSRVRSHSITWGASAQPRPNFDLYIEATNDHWSGKTDDPNSPDLGLYFPDSSVLVVGSNLTLNPLTSASIHYTEYKTDNANPLGLPQGNVRGRFLTTRLNYRSNKGYGVELSFVPWKVTDNAVSQWGYDSTLITISANTKF